MPYIDRNKEKYSNYWFSSTFAPNQWVFNKIVTPEAVDKLEQEGGICILYTHLGYYMINNQIDPGFIDRIKYISQKRNCWFAPVSTVLDFLRIRQRSRVEIPSVTKLKLEFIYLFIRFKYGKVLQIDDHTFKKMRSATYDE